MKMRKLFSFLLALLTALAAVLPAQAAEGEIPQEIAQPEESPAEGELPEWLLEPEDSETDPPADGTIAPADPAVPETPEIPENSEIPETPETPETPEEPVVPEDPSQPVVPEVPETPVIPEDPETPSQPETPVSPDDPSQPPDWLLPPEEVPLLPAAPGADNALPPENAIVEEAPIIEVLVPETGTAVVNPYGLPVMLDGQVTTEQIAGSVMLLENRSTVAVDVSVSAVASALGGVMLTAQPPEAGALEKAVFLYAEFQALPEPAAPAAWQGAFSDLGNQILLSAPYGSAKDGLMRLEASGLPFSWGAARLFGAAASHPAQPWQEGDGFHVNLTFTFIPVVSETPALDASGGADPDLDSAPAVPPEQGAAMEPDVTPIVPGVSITAPGSEVPDSSEISTGPAGEPVPSVPVDASVSGMPAPDTLEGLSLPSWLFSN